MSDIEGTKQVHISIGENELYLPDIGIFFCFPKIIEFETDAPEYTFYITKHGEYCNDGPHRYHSNDNKKLSRFNGLFTHARDAMPYVTIRSDVKGTLILHYTSWYKKKTPEKLEKERIEREKRLNYYNQFLTFNNGELFLDKRIHNYMPYEGYDAERDKILKTQRNKVILGKDITKVINVPRYSDVITHFKVNCKREQKLRILISGESVMTITLTPEKEVYRVIIPVRWMCYEECQIQFDSPEDIVSFEICGIVLYIITQHPRTIMVHDDFGEWLCKDGFYINK